MMKFLIIKMYFPLLIYTSVGNRGPCKMNKLLSDKGHTIEEPYTSPEEAGDFIEGDIIPSKHNNRNYNLKYPGHQITDEEEALFDNGTLDTANMFPQEYLGERWTNAIVPFVFHNLVGIDGRLQVIRAMNEYHRRTCITFKRHTNETDFLIIGSTMTSVCASSVGKQGGPQVLHLGSSCCRTIGTPMHELMHALGFIHEHMRPDRNKYVYINYTNIKPEFRSNFREVKPGTVPIALQIGYDFGSLMHYRLCAMTNNSWPTIVPKIKPKAKAIGQRRGFSRMDIVKLNTYYNCSKGAHAAVLQEMDFIQAVSRCNLHSVLGLHLIICSIEIQLYWF